MFWEISQNSQKNICTRVSFSIKLRASSQSCCPRPATLLKKRLWYRCFSVNFVKFLRTPFLQTTSGRLLLSCEISKIFKNTRFEEHLFTAASEVHILFLMRACFPKGVASEIQKKLSCNEIMFVNLTFTFNFHFHHIDKAHLNIIVNGSFMVGSKLFYSTTLSRLFYLF